MPRLIRMKVITKFLKSFLWAIYSFYSPTSTATTTTTIAAAAAAAASEAAQRLKENNGKAEY
jgi:hypothetical protein